MNAAYQYVLTHLVVEEGGFHVVLYLSGSIVEPTLSCSNFFGLIVSQIFNFLGRIILLKALL